MNIIDLADIYLTDPDSNFHTRRFATKQGYLRVLDRLKRDMGEKELPMIRIREVKRQHDTWTTHGVSMAHSLITMLRIIINFGASILEDTDCQRIAPLLSKMAFPNSAPRKTWLTAEQGENIRDVAVGRNYFCIALAQAIQTSTAMRQKDIIGEWIPVSEPEPSTIFSPDGALKWVRGVIREEVSADMILTHKTSKRGQVLSFDLKLCPAVVEEWFSAAESGPLVVDPETELPYQAWKFRRIWRDIATEAGIPKSIRNMDTRAGRITAVLDAGVSMEDARNLAGHENQKTTARYSRNSEEAINRSLRAALEKGEHYKDFAKRKWNHEE